MERLLVKWETARSLVAVPHTKIRDVDFGIGIIFYGTTTHAAYEAIDRFTKRGLKINSLRVRSFPFQDEVISFINDHETIFVIEQNRDAQLRTMLMTENAISPRKMQSILNFDGLPITADFITDKIRSLLDIDQQADTKGSKGGKS